MQNNKINSSNAIVTIYIPTHKRPSLLKRALKSVQEQTYRNLEIYVVVDGYCQETIEYISKAAEKDTRIVYTINNESVGACVSRNIAIKNATGDFITGLDDDDYFEKNRIECFLECWTDNENIAAIYTDTKIIKSESEIITTNKPEKVYKHFLYYRNYIGNQIFTTKEILMKTDLFDPALKSWQDLDLWLTLLKEESNYILKCNNSSYITDVSHNNNRISNQHLSNIRESHAYICKKHNISDKHKMTMTIIFLHYDKSLATIRQAIKMLILTKDLFATKLVLRFMLYHNLGFISKLYRKIKKQP